MGNRLCCIENEESQKIKPAFDLSNLNSTNIATSEKSFSRPLNKMTKKSLAAANLSLNKSSESNNTVYYSFDTIMDSRIEKSGFKNDDKENKENSTGNILGQLSEVTIISHEQAFSVDQSNKNREGPQASNDIRRSLDANMRENSSLQTNNAHSKGHGFNIITETTEEYEDESSCDPNGSLIKNREEIVLGETSNKFHKPQTSDEKAIPKEEGVFCNITNDPKHKLWIQNAEDGLRQIQSYHQKSLEGYEKIYEEKKNNHQLVIYMQSYVNQDGHRINKTRSEWYIPFRAAQFLKFACNVKEQKELDKNIDMFETLDVFGEVDGGCYFLYYLSYKKMMIASPRDFIYIKNYRRINETTWCDVSKSIIHHEYPEKKDKVRGDIILAGHLITEEIDPATGKIRSRIKLYSENNFKVNVPVFMAKNFASSEMKKYIEKCIQRLAQMYPENNI